MNIKYIYLIYLPTLSAAALPTPTGIAECLKFRVACDKPAISL
jgi:hypothetical protein